MSQQVSIWPRLSSPGNAGCGCRSEVLCVCGELQTLWVMNSVDGIIGSRTGVAVLVCSEPLLKSSPGILSILSIPIYDIPFFSILIFGIHAIGTMWVLLSSPVPDRPRPFQTKDRTFCASECQLSSGSALRSRDSVYHIITPTHKENEGLIHFLLSLCNIHLYVRKNRRKRRKSK